MSGGADHLGQPRTQRRVVVGVDGSQVSRQAVEWAAGEAAHRAAVLELHAAFDGHHVYLPPSDVRSRQAEVLQEASAWALAVEPDVEVKTYAYGGAPVRALLEASLGADLLVLGSRGLGGFAGLLLGSVSQQCALHAHCPVLIVRPSTNR